MEDTHTHTNRGTRGMFSRTTKTLQFQSCFVFCFLAATMMPFGFQFKNKTKKKGLTNKIPSKTTTVAVVAGRMGYEYRGQQPERMNTRPIISNRRRNKTKKQKKKKIGPRFSYISCRHSLPCRLITQLQ